MRCQKYHVNCKLKKRNKYLMDGSQINIWKTEHHWFHLLRIHSGVEVSQNTKLE